MFKSGEKGPKNILKSGGGWGKCYYLYAFMFQKNWCLTLEGTSNMRFKCSLGIKALYGHVYISHVHQKLSEECEGMETPIISES